jgi:hypothetical protein
MIAAFFAKPLVKYGAIALGILALVVGVVIYLDSVRKEGRKAGAAEVTGAVQTETIKKTDEARKDKVEADEKIRAKPIDGVIDGLR